MIELNNSRGKPDKVHIFFCGMKRAAKNTRRDRDGKRQKQNCPEVDYGNALPEEVWTEILLSCSRPSVSLSLKPPHQLQVLAIGCTSKFWRDVANKHCTTYYESHCDVSNAFLSKFTHLASLKITNPFLSFSENILAPFTNLTKLHIRTSKFSLGCLTSNLTALKLESYRVPLTELRHLTNITSLVIDEASDLEILPTFLHLKHLWVVNLGDAITVNLATLTNLESLGASFSDAHHLLATVSELPKLTNLQLRGWFSDYGFCTHLTKLTKIDIGGHNPTTQLLALENLKSLKLSRETVEIPLGVTKLTILHQGTWNFQQFTKFSELRKLIFCAQTDEGWEVCKLTSLNSIKFTKKSGITLDHVSGLDNLKNIKVLGGYRRYP
jgi:hypothetical protein